MRPITPMSPAKLWTIRLLGFAILGVGIYMFGTTAAIIFQFKPDPMGGSTGFPDKAWYGFVGLPLIAVGAFLLQFGFLRAVSRAAAGEVGDAVEHTGGRLGRGLAAGWGSGGTAAPKPEVRVKCRSCGFLESEDAKFCSGCAKPM